MNYSDLPPQSLAQSLARLQAKGLARLDAQLLLLHVLGLPAHRRGWLLAHDTDTLDSALAEPLNQLAQRRLAGEPLAYLVGHQEFFGLDLQVDARVLVPRPDTETLVNWALEVVQDQQCVLDLGTGSGAIALAIKSSRADLHVHATDASADALQVAQTNAQRLHLAVTFSQGSWFASLPDHGNRFDCIVSNPPYIAALDSHLAALTHEPQQALISDTDGLDDIRHIVVNAQKHLKAGGWLLLEHGYDQAPAVRHLLLAGGYQLVLSRQDLAGIERCSGGQFMS
jgi:release factor glutamine methyltransferase